MVNRLTPGDTEEAFISQEQRWKRKNSGRSSICLHHHFASDVQVPC